MHEAEVSGGTAARVVAVLAGGASRRMGTAKATVELGGRPLISYPIEAARRAGLRPLVVAKPDSPLPAPLACEPIREPAEPTHPLLGVLTALEAVDGPIVTCPCDAPFVPASLLAWLANEREPLVTVRAAGRLHPLLARYTPALVPSLRDALERSAPLGETLVQLGARIPDDRELRPFGDPETIVRNLNTPEDLAAAEHELATGPPPG